MKNQLVIFDLDGTVLDTLDDLAASVNAALSAHSLPTLPTDVICGYIGNGIRLLIERSVPAGTPKELTDEVFAFFKTHYKVHCADKTRPYDGIPELLAALRDAGCRTAVVSNKADFAVKDLCERYFPGLFDAAVGENEAAGVRKKPAPDSVNAILADLAVERSAAVYVGDSDVDIETAKNAGLPCLSVTWGFRSREFLLKHGASVLLDTPEQLKAALLS